MCFDLDINISLDELTKVNRPNLYKDTIYDVLIVGGGPAGLNAALYLKRKGAMVGIIASSIGGQITDTSSVENYLGYQSITGEGLVKKFIEHIESLNIPIVKNAFVNSIDLINGSNLKELILSTGESYRAKSIIIATGSKPRKLNIPGEAEFFGRGVAYCAICDGPLFTGKDVVVIGGGNSAVEATIDLSKIVNNVTLINRSELKADKILLDQLVKLNNVNIVLNTEIQEILGDRFVSGVKVLNKVSGGTCSIAAKGVFIEIGYLPNSEPFKNIINLNDKGEIEVDLNGRTNVEGIFAAGDVTNAPYKQIILSAADGAKCALSANDYLNTLNINKK